MCDNRRKVDGRLSWVKVGFDGAEVPEVLTGREHKWRVGGWVGGLYVKLKEVGMDGKGTLKIFNRKKRELIKTPSISKKSRSGSPGPQTGACSLSILQEQPRRDGTEITVSSSPFSPSTSSTSSSSSSSSTLTPTSAGFLDPSHSCPGTPAAQHTKQGVSNMATLKRPTSLSRHASAAGFPLQSWVLAKAQGKGALTPTTPMEGLESTAIEVEDIPALLRDVARFAEAVEKLKDVVLAEGMKESRRPVAHECLGEVLRVLRQVINTYPLLNTVEILTAAGKLISKVKAFHYELCNDADKLDFEKAIETIAVAFSSNVSELLMGEVDSSTLLSLLPTEKSRSLENLYTAHGADGGLTQSDSHDIVQDVEVNDVLQRTEGGVDLSLVYAKSLSKYMKDLISYVEKRTSLELEFSKGLQRLYHSCKHSITNPQMPLYSIYSLALEQDVEQCAGLQHAYTTLHTQTFIQPLMQRKQEHEKKRKELKEHWIRAKRKLMECEANLRKAKQAYIVRCEDHEKAKAAASRAEEEEATAKSLEKKKRVEEEARYKAEEAEATYKTCIADATTQDNNLQHTKGTVLRQLQELVKQSDQTLRSATISFYQIMHMQTVALPVHYQTLCESSKLYDLGQEYAAYVQSLPVVDPFPTQYVFEPYSASTHHPHRSRNDSFNAEPSVSAEGSQETREAEVNRKRLGHKSWGSTVSDDSVGAAGLDSPTISSNDIRKMARTSSTGTMSSNEDADEKDGNVPSFETPNINGMEPDVVVSTGPFRNIGLSKAAQTHRLRKLRTPSKCRECDSYVYFQGAECEECFLACHKRCLETLAIQCGHKKLQGRLQLFGRDFSQVASCASDGIPFIITKCISEIERRALKLKGIYRVNGVKTRVEKLCQAFENGKELVELSECSPHDISNVLKLYLRQLPEPIMLFRLYNHLMGLSKESLHHEAAAPEGEEAESSATGGGGGGGLSGIGARGPELVDLGADTDPETLVLVEKLKKLLKELPKANLATLRYIMRHLRRISELEQENKMSPSNLGIVFGPSLMRPRPTGATVSLSSLVDYPHQARIIEAFIVFYTAIFPSKSTTSPTGTTAQPSCVADGSSEAEEAKETSTPDSDKLEEEGCASSPGSMGSNDQLPDSDPESSEPADRADRPRLTKQQSQYSMDEDQASNRDSLDLSCPLVVCTGPEDDPEPADGPEVPALPDSEPPEEDVGAEQEPEPEPDPEQVQELSVALAELNVNQSNNNCPLLPVPGRAVTRVCRRKLPLTRNRDNEPEFV